MATNKKQINVRVDDEMHKEFNDLIAKRQKKVLYNQGVRLSKQQISRILIREIIIINK